MNKLFAIGMLAMIIASVSAVPWWNMPPKIGDETEGKMMLGGDSGITNNAADEDGKATSFGADITPKAVAAGIDDDGMKAKGDDEGKVLAAGGDISDRADEDGKAPVLYEDNVI